MKAILRAVTGLVMVALLTPTAQAQTHVGGGPNSGTVSAGGANQVAFYQTAGAVVRGDANFTWNYSASGINFEWLGLGSGATQLAPGNLLSGVQSINGSMQLNWQNTSSGVNASTDLIGTTNAGSNVLGYIDVGINGSGYSEPAYNSGVGGDGYLLVFGSGSGNGNLNEIAGQPNTAITFNIGGTTLQQMIMSLTNPSNTAPNLTLQNPLPIIGAALTLTTATQQTAQSFAVNGQALTFTGSYGSSGTVTIAGTFTACATSACVGWAMTVAGATNPSNNGIFILTASTSSLLTFTNWFGVSETLPTGATVTSSANTTSYAGTITGGGATAALSSGAYAGIPAVTVASFATHTVYNGTTFPVIASTTGYIAVTNAAAAGTAADSSGGTIHSTAVVNSPVLSWKTAYGSGAGTQGTDVWSCQDVMGSVGTNPTSAFTCSHTGTSGVATAVINGVTLAGAGPALTSPTTITSASFVTTGLVMPTIPVSTTAHGHCTITWEQTTGVATVSFGAGMSNAPTDLWITSKINTAATGANVVAWNTQTATTATIIGAATTPAVAATPYYAEFDFVLQVGATNPVALTFYGLTSNTSDALVIEPGSYCSWLP